MPWIQEVALNLAATLIEKGAAHLRDMTLGNAEARALLEGLDTGRP